MDLKKFRKRLRVLYSRWASNWCNTEVLLISTLASSSGDSTFHCPMSSVFFKWLLGHHHPRMVAVFTTKQIHFLCSSTKPPFPKDLKDWAHQAVGVDLVVHVNEKGDKKQLGSCQVDEILEMVSEGPDSKLTECVGLKKKCKSLDDEEGNGFLRRVVVGCIAEEKLQVEVLATCEKTGKVKGFELVWEDVSNGLSRLLRVGSEKEVLVKMGDEEELNNQEGDAKVELV